MDGKLIYLASKDEYIFITPMALTSDIKDELQEDMMDRLGVSVAIISGCNSFEYIPSRVNTHKDLGDTKC